MKSAETQSEALNQAMIKRSVDGEEEEEEEHQKPEILFIIRNELEI